MKFKEYLNKSTAELTELYKKYTLELTKTTDKAKIAIIKDNISNIKATMKKIPGNQEASADYMDTAVQGIQESIIQKIDKKYDTMADDFEDFLVLMKKADTTTANKIHKYFEKLTSAYEDYLNSQKSYADII